jgi:hypothetical protein
MELRRIGPEAFEDLLPMLQAFKNRRMSRSDWHGMLFGYPWASERRHGYGFFAAGQLVGFLGTIFSRRSLAGRLEQVCNFSTWIVREEHRGSSVLMVRPLLADLEGYTIIGFTPAPTTCAVFSRFGFVPFETHRLLLQPLPSRRRSWRSLGARWTSAPERIGERLSGAEADIFRDIGPCRRVRHVLLSRGQEQCYLIARLDRPGGIRAAELLYVGNLDFFWEHRTMAHLAFLSGMGALALVIDERFTRGWDVHATQRLDRVRLYRPSRSDINPDAIDGLYSELVTLRE